MDGIFPAVFVLMAAPRRRRSRLAETLLPAMVPVAASQRVAVAAIAADQQIRDAEAREQRVASEVVSAVEQVAAGPSNPNKTLTDAEVNAAMPTLTMDVNRKRVLLTRVNAVKLAADQRAEAGAQQVAAEVVTAINTAAANQDNKLTDAQLGALPRLKALVDSGSVSTLRADIDKAALTADAKNLASEVISAIDTAAANPNNQLTDAQLAALPRLAAVVNRVPAVRGTIDRVALAVALAADADRLPEDTISAIDTAAANANNQLTDAQLAALPRLAAVVNRVPAVRQRIDAIAGQLP